MGKQATEILKGVLEGIVLAILSDRPAYGYEITARLRDQGFSDIAEGTIYALLVRIEQRLSLIHISASAASANPGQPQLQIADSPSEPASRAETMQRPRAGRKINLRYPRGCT